MNFDSISGDTSNSYACINEFCISRKGGFTCPVKSLMVFVSSKYIDIMDSSLKAYNDMRNYENFKAFQKAEQNISMPYKLIRRAGYEFCEFEFTKDNLKPVLWINFYEESHVKEIEIKLKYEVAGKYLYIKLIHPQDCREERH